MKGRKVWKLPEHSVPTSIPIVLWMGKLRFSEVKSLALDGTVCGAKIETLPSSAAKCPSIRSKTTAHQDSCPWKVGWATSEGPSSITVPQT